LKFTGSLVHIVDDAQIVKSITHKHTKYAYHFLRTRKEAGFYEQLTRVPSEIVATDIAVRIM